MSERPTSYTKNVPPCLMQLYLSLFMASAERRMSCNVCPLPILVDISLAVRQGCAVHAFFDHTSGLPYRQEQSVP